MRDVDSSPKRCEDLASVQLRLAAYYFKIPNNLYYKEIFNFVKKIERMKEFSVGWSSLRPIKHFVLQTFKTLSDQLFRK